jgi:N-acyl-D-amino-acid deacylase
MAGESCDVLFRNATVIDGSGAPRREADVAVRGERIAALGRLEGWRAGSETDASGRVLAPGFIDVHTHDDRLLLAEPQMTPKLSQGVTTVIGGNCGISLAPLVAERVPPPLDLLDAGGSYRYPRFADYLEELGARPAALNAALLVGHSTLRVATMDRLDRAATKAEIARMRTIVAESLDAGAIGLSTGLFYAPANAAPTEEVIELCAPLHARGALYVTHMRDEADQLLDSLEETFRIGREAATPAFISHHKAAGVANHGKTRQSLAAIEAAMRTQPVALDAYPYVASSTVLRWDMAERASKTVVTWSTPHPELAGKALDEIARAMGCEPQAAAARLQPAGAVYFMMSEEDVRRVLAFEHTMIGSDGLPHDVHPHPRLWGTFPRVLGHYARDEGLFTLEQAVHKMTGLSARNFGLEGRGFVAVGAYADLTLFDAARVRDAATFENPATPAEGIELVMVNGQIAWRDGRPTEARAGRVLRRQAERPDRAS